MPDMQQMNAAKAGSVLSVLVVCLQLLTGRMPDMGQAVASKASGVALSNTSLVQCNKTHLAAFYDDDIDSSTQVHAQLPMK